MPKSDTPTPKKGETRAKEVMEPEALEISGLEESSPQVEQIEEPTVPKPEGDAPDEKGKDQGPRRREIGFASVNAMIPEYAADGKLKIRDFLQIIETVTALGGLTEPEKILCAKLNARGLAHSYFWKDPILQKAQNFKEFSQIVVNRFDKEPIAMRWTNLNATRQTQLEDVAAFAARICEIAETLKPPDKEHSSSEEFLRARGQCDQIDQLVTTQFCIGLRESLRKSVLDAGPADFESAVQLALRFEQNELMSRTKGRVAGLTSEKEETTALLGVLVKIQAGLEEQARLIRNMTQQRENPRGLNRWGYPQRRETPNTDSRLVRRQCYACGSTQHLIRECPQAGNPYRAYGRYRDGYPTRPAYGDTMGHRVRPSEQRGPPEEDTTPKNGVGPLPETGGAQN